MLDPNEATIPRQLREAVENTFQTQAQLPVQFCSVTTDDSSVNNKDTSYNCMSVIGISSDQLSGTLALAFPKDTYLAVTERLLGDKQIDLTDDNADACSELLNIIFASARIKINKSGFNFSPAIPTVATGEKLDIALSEKHKTLCLVFQTEYGKFLLAISLQRTKK
jgi:CheY-specific phosphatase CheX